MEPPLMSNAGGAMVCSDNDDAADSTIPIAPLAVADRVKGQAYLCNGKKCIWGGQHWHCEHGRQRYRCKDCGGSGLCEHDRVRSQCKTCCPGSSGTSRKKPRLT